MKIIWTRLATGNLKEMCEYKKRFNKSKNVRRSRKSVFDKVSNLKKFPKIGIKTESKILKDMDMEFRKIVHDQYGIIYMLGNSNIYIVRIFDSRQDDEKKIF